MTEVSRQAHPDDAGIRGRRRGHELEGSIGAAVVHEHDLVRSARQVVEHLREALEKLREDRFLVVEGDRDRDAPIHAATFGFPLK